LEENIIYQDKLVEISADSILLKSYYIPFAASKRILFAQIKSVAVQKPSICTGQARIWGSGDFMTWFPLDIARYNRDRIFKLTLLSQRVRIGFTVENSEAVVQIFEQKGLIGKTNA